MNAQSNTHFGQRIRRYRKKKGWSIKELATVMHVQRTSLSRWENGHEMPCGQNMTKLRDHLQMPIGTSEDAIAPIDDRTYQFLLPFDPPIDLELKVTPKRPDIVQFQVQLKSAAS
jgi:transcriptional regulator with XRE-family HTH domain